MNTVSHYVMLGGEQQGPLSFDQLKNLWRSGQVNRETLHFMDGYSEWMPLEIMEEDLDPPMARPSAAAYRASRPVVTAKSRGIYVILGLFLGGLVGIHNFYIGRFGVGVAQLIITIFTGWLIAPLLLVAAWVIIELMVVTKDGNGHKLA